MQAAAAVVGGQAHEASHLRSVQVHFQQLIAELGNLLVVQMLVELDLDRRVYWQRPLWFWNLFRYHQQIIDDSVQAATNLVDDVVGSEGIFHRCIPDIREHRTCVQRTRIEGDSGNVTRH